MTTRVAAHRPPPTAPPPPLPLPRAEAVGLVAAVIAAACPLGSTAALGPLAAALVQLGDRVGQAPHRAPRTVAPLVHGWLANVGVVRAGRVPPELVMWLTWADGLRSPDRAPRQREVPLGWRILSIDAALGARMELQRRGASAGAWLPLVTNRFGDHHVFVADCGGVTSQYRDEATPPAHPTTDLHEYARALIAVWA